MLFRSFNTGKLLNRPASVAVDAHSGLAGVAMWINGKLATKGHNEVYNKRDPLIADIKSEIDAKYDTGRTTSMGDDELFELVKTHDMDLYKKIK